MKKKCCKCGRLLEINNFYKHKEMADGYLNTCKECHNTQNRLCREQNYEHYKNYEKGRMHTNKRKELVKKYVKKYRQAHPGRSAIYSAVNTAIKKGQLIKPSSCSMCGTFTKLVAHHIDYSKPLNVIFICQRCHKKTHVATNKNLDTKNTNKV